MLENGRECVCICEEAKEMVRVTENGRDEAIQLSTMSYIHKMTTE